MQDIKEVQNYYDYTLPFYKVFYHGETRALHCGMYETPTDSFKKALTNTNDLIIEKAGIHKDSVVLDAGCGVGGTVFWIAQKTEAKVTGITISEKQYEKAIELSGRYGLSDKTTFVQGDYCTTPFPDESFDVVYGIESICHAHARIDHFLKEVRRILKPDGKFVTVDGFVGDVMSDRDRKNLKVFERGLAVEKLITPDALVDELIRQNFTDVQFEDKTKNILPTARRLHFMSRFSYPISIVTCFIGLTPKIMIKNSHAGLVQKDLIERGVLQYGVVVAKKQ